MPQLTVCPDCAEPRHPDDKFCGGCGIDLTAVPEKPPVAEAAPPHPAAPPDWALAAPVTPPAPPMAPPAPVPPMPAAPPAPAVPPVPQHAPSPDSTAGPGRPVPAQAGPQEGAGSAAPAAPPAAPPSWALSTPAAPVPASWTPPPGPNPVEPSEPTGQAAPTASAAPDAPRNGVAPAPGSVDPREPTEPPAAPEGPWAGKVCVACGTGGIDGDGYCEHCGHAQPRERDHMERELDGVAGVSDRGLRHHRNEDAFQISATSLPDGAPAVVAVVCDGVSSATRPDEASAAAAAAANDALLDALESGTVPEKAMHDALLTAAEAVNLLSSGPSRDHNAPACTCVSAIASDGTVTIGWVGDSRAYWIPDDRRAPERLTEDDSWAARMVAAGLMSEEDAYADERAHAITGWLGADAVEVDPHTASFHPDRPGVVVVCTDGLWNYAESVAAMAAAVPADARTRPLRSAQHLVGFALDSGGHDNVTVAVLPFPPAPGRTPAQSPGHASATPTLPSTPLPAVSAPPHPTATPTPPQPPPNPPPQPPGPPPAPPLPPSP